MVSSSNPRVTGTLQLSELAPRTVQSEIRALTVACDNMGGVNLAKRTILVEGLRAAGLTPHIPDGACYILAGTGSLSGANAAGKARDLLARTGVGSVAGSAFFRPGSPIGENLLRFCFAKKDHDLIEACRRLRTL